MEKKPFKERKLGKFLASKGFNEILEQVGNFIPGVGVLDAIKDAVLGTETKGPEVVLTPEDRAAFLALYQEELKELDMLLKDRADARATEVARLQSGSKNYTQNILAYLGVSAFFFIVAYVIAFGLAEMSSQESFIIGNLTGIAGAICKDIYGYYFGGSKGSSDKNDIMKKMMDQTNG